MIIRTSIAAMSLIRASMDAVNQGGDNEIPNAGGGCRGNDGMCELRTILFPEMEMWARCRAGALT